MRDRVLAAARSKDKDHAEEAVDAVIPVLELAAQLDDLEIEVDFRPVIRMRPRGSTTPSTWGLIAAKALRKEWGVSSGPILDIPGLIEKRTRVMVVVATLPEGVDGLTITDPLNENTVLAVSETDLWERQRFTLAHELGHLVAGDRVI